MKRKLNLKKPEISSEEIAKGKDFRSVLNKVKSAPTQAPSKPFFRTWYGLSSAVVAVTALVTLVLVNPFSGDDSISSPLTEQPEKNVTAPGEDFTYNTGNKGAFVSPPWKHLDKPFETYRIRGDKGGEIITATGSRVRIPKGSLQDENGQTVKGDVEVKVREFHDPIDFFLSGIPMHYDSAGKQFDFESAGMIEVYAFQGGKVLKINPDKPVSISLKTNSSDTKYNVYELDTAGRNWTYRGKDKVKVAEQEVPVEGKDTLAVDPMATKIRNDKVTIGNFTQSETVVQNPTANKILQEIQIIQKDINKLNENRPIEPKKAKKELFRFNIDVNKKEFPELALYKDVQWEVDPSNKDFSEEMYNITWEDAVLKEGDTRGMYVLSLKKGSLKKQFRVYPVFEGADYEKAVKMYEDKFKEYTQKLSDKKDLEQKKQQEYKELVERIKKEQETLKKQSEETMKKMKEEQEKQKMVWNLTDNVTREFNIRSFGIWNCDNPHLRNAKTAVVMLFDEKGQPVKGTRVCLVDMKLNGIVPVYVVDNIGNFRYNPGGSHFMWTVMEDGTLLACSESDWNNRERIKMNGTFDKIVLKNTGVDAKDPASIKKYFFETAASF